MLWPSSSAVVQPSVVWRRVYIPMPSTAEPAGSSQVAFRLSARQCPISDRHGQRVGSMPSSFPSLLASALPPTPLTTAVSPEPNAVTAPYAHSTTTSGESQRGARHSGLARSNAAASVVARVSYAFAFPSYRVPPSPCFPSPSRRALLQPSLVTHTSYTAPLIGPPANCTYPHPTARISSSTASTTSLQDRPLSTTSPRQDAFARRPFAHPPLRRHGRPGPAQRPHRRPVELVPVLGRQSVEQRLCQLRQRHRPRQRHQRPGVRHLPAQRASLPCCSWCISERGRESLIDGRIVEQTYISSVCTSSPCSNSTLASAKSTLDSGCSTDIQNDVPAAVALYAPPPHCHCYLSLVLTLES